VSDRAARDQLVLAHAAWARRTVLQTIRRLRITIDPEEAIAAANLALVEAAGRYTPGGPAAFTTFAHRRIVGAVLDRAHELSDAYRERAGSGGGERLYPPAPVALEALANRLRAPDPHGAADARLEVERLLAVLTPREREVLRLAYVEDLPLVEVGRRLGVTESRACQISHGAVRKMRAFAASRLR